MELTNLTILKALKQVGIPRARIIEVHWLNFYENLRKVSNMWQPPWKVTIERLIDLFGIWWVSVTKRDILLMFVNWVKEEE